MEYIYVAITATPCFTGRFIRTITNSAYNHVSICFEPSLREMYSFARRYKSTPFCGGFVRESSNRYRQKGRVAKLLLFKVPISDREYADIENRLRNFIENNKDYVYNNLSAVMSLLHLKIKVRNSYTCVEFATEQLSRLSAFRGRLKGDFYSIDSLKEALSPFLVYSGPFPTKKQGWGEDRFDKKLSLSDIIGEEYRDNKKLLSNFIVTVCPSFGEMMFPDRDKRNLKNKREKSKRKREGRTQ